MQKNKYFLIYQITNLINGNIYIGKHETYDIDDGYLGSGKLLKRAYKKHGVENFKKEILFECDTLEELNIKEAELVTEEFIKRKDTYNIVLGGDGGDTFTNNPNREIIRKRMAKYGEKNGMFGKKHSEESKRKIRKNKKGQRKGVPTWNKGLTKENYSDEYIKSLKKRRYNGATSPTAKKYLIIDPFGHEYIVHGTLDYFCKEHGLNTSNMRYFVDKGVVQKSNRKCPIERIRVTGWEIQTIKG